MNKKKLEIYIDNMLIRNIIKNDVFKIMILPLILFVFCCSKSHDTTVKMVNKIEKFLSNEDTELQLRYVFIFLSLSSLITYLLTFISEIVFEFYFQCVVINSFKAFTYEYIMINHTDFLCLGAGEIRAIIERRTKSTCYSLKRLILESFQPIAGLIVTYISLSSEYPSIVIFFNLGILLFFIILMTIAAIVVTLCKIYFNISYNHAANTLYEFLTNHEVVLVYNTRELELANIYNILDDVRSKYFLYEQAEHFFCALSSFLVIAPNIILIYYGLANHNSGIFLSFASFSNYDRRFTLLKDKYKCISQNFTKITELFVDATHTSIDNVLPDNNFIGEEIFEFKEKIRFNDVCFDIGDHRILDNISLDIKKGEKIAFVGANGSGKSSFFSLLLKFKQYSGQIYIDGKEYRSVSTISLRNLISFIPQHSNILDLTVLENLKYSHNELSNEEIMKKCIIFDTHDVFSSLKNGYLTRVGENGRNISGGQKQLINFMRGVLKDGDIFLLDEPSSNLDHKAESTLFKHIFSSLKHKTVLAIVHSPDYLSEFDKILGFRDKKVKVYNSYNEFLLEEHLY